LKKKDQLQTEKDKAIFDIEYSLMVLVMIVLGFILFLKGDYILIEFEDLNKPIKEETLGLNTFQLFGVILLLLGSVFYVGKLCCDRRFPQKNWRKYNVFLTSFIIISFSYWIITLFILAIKPEDYSITLNLWGKTFFYSGLFSILILIIFIVLHIVKIIRESFEQSIPEHKGTQILSIFALIISLLSFLVN